MSDIGLNVNVHVQVPPDTKVNVAVTQTIPEQKSVPINGDSVHAGVKIKTGAIPAIKGAVAGGIAGGLASAIILNSTDSKKFEVACYVGSATIGALVANMTDKKGEGAGLGLTLGIVSGATVMGGAGLFAGLVHEKSITAGLTMGAVGAFMGGLAGAIPGAAAGFGGGLVGKQE